MASVNPNDPQLLRNLASALREVEKQTDQRPKLPTVTDEDILRAMLGKPRTADRTTPVRKAG
jgi:hypothetical protein